MWSQWIRQSTYSQGVVYPDVRGTANVVVVGFKRGKSETMIDKDNRRRMTDGGSTHIPSP